MGLNQPATVKSSPCLNPRGILGPAYEPLSAFDVLAKESLDARVHCAS